MKKSILRLVVLFVILLLAGRMATAQNNPKTVTVQGRVLDEDRKPVRGVTVAEVDADQRTIKAARTDVDGNYVVRVENTADSLMFSYIGAETITQGIGNRTTVNVTLNTKAKGMDEVVVVSQAKTDNGLMPISDRDRTTAASRINAKEMEEMQAASIDQALQGRLPGVDIAASSGDPGAGMQIRIRGTSSINSSTDPLIVVDGMPYETQIPADFNFGAADELGYASLLNIAPSDIKDITILKDAAATAVWGSRGANGVLVINTKRGTVGKPVLTYTFKGSVTRQPNAIPMLSGDQYSTLIPEEYMNRNGTPLNTQTIKEFQYDPNDPYWYHNYSNNTNWVDAITRPGWIQDHNLSMSGGGEKARYYASVGYLDQTGTTIGTGLKRISTRINLNYDVSTRIKFRSDVSFSHTDNDKNYANNLRDIAYKKMPNMSIYEYDEFGNLTPNFFSPASNIQGQFLGIDTRNNIQGTVNPVAMATDAKYNVTTERVTPHFNLQYTILRNVLNAVFDVQFDINNTKTKSFLPQTATGRPWTETSVNRAYDGDVDVFNVQTKTSLIYTPHFKNPKHNYMSSLILFTYDNKSVKQEARTSNTASSLLTDPSDPSRTQNADLAIASGTAQTRSIGATFSHQYSYLDRYIINVGARMDGNSRFGPAYRYGYFPSVSARYRLSGEPFMKKYQNWLDDLSIRASYGISGNAPRRDYTFYNIYSDFDWGYLGQAAVYPSNMELKNLRWETITGQNLGFDLMLFKGRVSLDVEIYKNRTKQLFFDGLQISSFTGFNSVSMNVGTMDNQGMEIGLNTTPYRSSKLQIDLNFNIAKNQNIIREISPFYPTEKGNITGNGQYKTFMQVNNPFGSFYGFRYLGVYKDAAATIATGADGKPILDAKGQPVYMRFNYPATAYVFQPGDARYEDMNHDGNINYMDAVYLGNSNPKFTGGFGASATFKGRLKLTAFFNYRYGYDVINQTKMLTTNMYGYDNQSTAVLRRWRKEGDETDIPRALFGSGYNWLGSDRYVEDASFIRFRTMTLRYTFAPSLIQRLRIRNLSAYLTVENLYTWTNYTGQDPEVSLRGSDPFRVATDQSVTPPSKTFTIGLTGSF
ncbi:SusC/RagA family TonB-linked outer membrane protein [Niabella soli]|uniref:Membrane protein n=1 Tax=Niabella soli DSM 19437 TaxID=929713 RepID=W0EWH6_9BACT|nr:SusC/RagA family TonB-linked outer membrane protein [Niabella soli]AHF15132.1 membrane protein [Niabella soli DSM 19437]